MSNAPEGDPAPSRRHVLVSGLRGSGADLLFDAIAPNFAAAGYEVIPRLLPHAEAVSHPFVLSYAPVELLRLATYVKKLTGKVDVVRLIVVRDPRELLALRHPDNGSFVYGPDHALHETSDGVMTFSDPGLVPELEAIIDLGKRNGTTIPIRYEVFRAQTRGVLKGIEKAVGIPVDLTVSTQLSEQLEALAAVDTSGKAAARVARYVRLSSPRLAAAAARFGYDVGPDWLAAEVARHPDATDDRPGTIVGYYTAGTIYEAEAERLAATTTRLGLPTCLEPLPGGGDWLTNVRRKPGVLQTFRERMGGPLLYVDADAVVHRDPWPYLRGYGGDVAVAGHHATNIISGTILLNDTPGARLFLDRWIAEQARNPAAWDQHSLQDAVLANAKLPPQDRVTIDFLPPSLCRVFDRRYADWVDNIVEHLQASRESRFLDTPSEGLTGLQSRRRRIAEIEADILPNRSGPSDLSKIIPDYRALPPEERRSRSVALAAQGASDIGRWASEKNFIAGWSERAAIVAKIIGPVGSVLDLGCGMMDLERHLARGTVYIPSDLMPRDGRTIVADLNAGELPDTDADVVTMLGVLEYIHDPRALVTALARRYDRLVLTYNPADIDGKRDRRALGWFNDLASAEVVGMVSDAGFDLEAILPFERFQRIYAFRRMGGPSQ